MATMAKISLTIVMPCEPWYDHKYEAMTAVPQSMKTLKSVSQSCGDDEFIDESTFYHTT